MTVTKYICYFQLLAFHISHFTFHMLMASFELAHTTQSYILRIMRLLSEKLCLNRIFVHVKSDKIDI